MKGLELSRRYFEAYGESLLAQFPAHRDRIAAGLAGMGSECFGFDDGISTDHDYGPGFCLWLTPEDYEAIGPALQQAYQALPGEFLGVGPRQTCDYGAGRVGVMTIPGFYGMFVGQYQPPATDMDWLRLPESYLACAVNGQVFRDPLGRFSAVREALSAGYPEDVRRKKLAARAVTMAQTGQYNYARSMARGETAAAWVALGKFMEAAASMAHLLCRRYTPFYKWAFRSMTRLPLPAELTADLTALSRCSLTPEGWPGTDKPLTVLNTADRPVVLIERICAGFIRLLRQQGLTHSTSDFLQEHAESITAGIQSPDIRAIFISEG